MATAGAADVSTPDVRNFDELFTREHAQHFSSFEHPVFADADDPRRGDFAGFSYNKSLGSSSSSSGDASAVSASFSAVRMVVGGASCASAQLAGLLERDVKDIERTEVVHCFQMAKKRLVNLFEIVDSRAMQGEGQSSGI